MLSILLSAFLLGGYAAAAVVPRAFSAPSANGFPNPDNAQTVAIAQEAGGLLPNSPPPMTLGADAVTALQLIAFNELFETAFFNSLLQNVTNDVAGYTTSRKAALVEVITAVRAQEEQHALAAITSLQAAGKFAPSPCQYMFPASNLNASVALAETVTSIVLGALQGANVAFATANVPALIQVISAVIGQEGEQNGFYRTFLQQIPSESPFLTPVPAPFAFTALQLFVVPGSCPFPLSRIDLTIFPGLMVNGGPVAVVQRQDQDLSFTADLSNSTAAQPYIGKDGRGLYITYTTGQQLPISVAITGVKFTGSMISFNAQFPFTEHVMEGFTHAALTTTKNFTSSNAVVNSTLAAPAVIQALKPLA